MLSAAPPAGVGSTLPSLPIVVARLVTLYSSEEYTIDQVVELLETDPSISSRILRLANSAYYGFESKVDTLQRAGVLLGAAVVQAVALGASIPKPGTGGPLPRAVEDLWVLAYLCAQGCRYLALRLPPEPNRSRPDALFLAGLLRDVGKILFLAEDEASYTAILKKAQSSEQLRELERQRFGVDHAEAGGELLESWNLPSRTTALVRFHHRGGLRAEWQADWEVLTAATAAANGQDQQQPTGILPPDLLGDLAAHLERKRPEAHAFYGSVS